MLLKLNVYTDETITELKRVCEADKLKIPYRVAMYLIQSLDGVNLDNKDDIIKFISSNIDKMDKILKATFGVSESELDCLDAGELIETLKELYKWGVEKVSKLSDKNSKNVVAPVSL